MNKDTNTTIECFDFTDINECAQNNGGCSHDCTNIMGSYYCACLEGQTMSSDNHTCVGKETNDVYCVLVNVQCGQFMFHQPHESKTK